MSRSARRSTRSRKTTKTTGAPALPRRAAVVWVSFLAAMTVVGGLLLVLDGRPAPRVDGMSLSPLAAAGLPSTSESIARTRRAMDGERWKAIVIHHSGSPVGSPTAIASEHEASGRVGLGHHFIVGNGSGMEDGQLHVGYRWLDQLAGAHAAGPDGEWLNHHAVSICLVGDGNRRSFTPAQLKRLDSLVAALRKELSIPADRVYLHSDVAPSADPGRLFPASDFRAGLGR